VARRLVIGVEGCPARGGHESVGGLCQVCGSPWPCSEVRKRAAAADSAGVGGQGRLIDGRASEVDSFPRSPSRGLPTICLPVGGGSELPVGSRVVS
jgi:hypothetical protein